MIMNRQKTTIAMFAIIAAVAMTTISLTGVSATPMAISAIPQTTSGMGILGHVEYTVMDNSGNIVAYNQADNTVVDDGKDCVARMLFGVPAGSSNCGSTLSEYTYIAIGNGTGTISTPDNGFVALNSTGTSLCAESGAAFSQSGEMARKNVTATWSSIADDGAGDGAIVVLDTSSEPFSFDAANATTVFQSGIFNADITTPNANNSCGTPGTAGGTWNMFSIQELNPGSGIDVTAGDSLSVKWTITVG